MSVVITIWGYRQITLGPNLHVTGSGPLPTLSGCFSSPSWYVPYPWSQNTENTETSPCLNMVLSSWQACWASARLSSVLSHAPLLVLPENPALPGMTCPDTSPRYKAARCQGIPAFLLVSPVLGLTVFQAATECFPRLISVLSPGSTASLFSSSLLFSIPFPLTFFFLFPFSVFPQLLWLCVK